MGVREVLFVFLGGGAGSVLRYAVSELCRRWPAAQAFPLGTFIVNILGSFLIGVLAGHLIKADSSLKLLLITGFCGGFTTFSTFSAENASLLQNGNYGIALLNMVLSLVVGLLAVMIGWKVAG